LLRIKAGQVYSPARNRDVVKNEKTIFLWSILFLLANVHSGETQELIWNGRAASHPNTKSL